MNQFEPSQHDHSHCSFLVSALARAVGLIFALIVSTGTMAGQCEPAWDPVFADGNGVNNRVNALIVFDDGTGPALYAGGEFTQAGGVSANRIAKWDGQQWSALGSGLNDRVRALAVFDDGTGPALYAGGEFSQAGGVSADRIAKWNGQQWSPLGSGLNERVRALAVFDDGTGPALYVGGNFDAAGGASANLIARWDGNGWSALDTGLSGFAGPWVDALTVFDDGSGDGPALYAGGRFNMAGSNSAIRIASWDGTNWSALGTGIGNGARSLEVYDDRLAVGGGFATAGGEDSRRIAIWDGTSWSTLGSGFENSPLLIPATVLSLKMFDDGSGSALYAGGRFDQAGDISARNIARWDGNDWSPLDSGIGETSGVGALTIFDTDSGMGPALYAGGRFNEAGGEGAGNIAKWQGCRYADASVTPELINFGQVAIGDTSAPLNITLANDGNGPLEVTAFDGPEAPFAIDFSDCGSLPLSIAAGATCTIAATFAPTRAVEFSGSLEIISNDPSSPHRVDLAGTGMMTAIPVPNNNPWALALLLLAVGLTGWLALCRIEGTLRSP